MSTSRSAGGPSRESNDGQQLLPNFPTTPLSRFRLSSVQPGLPSGQAEHRFERNVANILAQYAKQMEGMGQELAQAMSRTVEDQKQVMYVMIDMQRQWQASASEQLTHGFQTAYVNVKDSIEAQITDMRDKMQKKDEQLNTTLANVRDLLQSAQAADVPFASMVKRMAQLDKFLEDMHRMPDKMAGVLSAVDNLSHEGRSLARLSEHSRVLNDVLTKSLHSLEDNDLSETLRNFSNSCHAAQKRCEKLKTDETRLSQQIEHVMEDVSTTTDMMKVLVGNKGSLTNLHVKCSDVIESLDSVQVSIRPLNVALQVKNETLPSDLTFCRDGLHRVKKSLDDARIADILESATGAMKEMDDNKYTFATLLQQCREVSQNLGPLKKTLSEQTIAADLASCKDDLHRVKTALVEGKSAEQLESFCDIMKTFHDKKESFARLHRQCGEATNSLEPLPSVINQFSSTFEDQKKNVSKQLERCTSILIDFKDNINPEELKTVIRNFSQIKLASEMLGSVDKQEIDSFRKTIQKVSTMEIDGVAEVKRKCEFLLKATDNIDLDDLKHLPVMLDKVKETSAQLKQALSKQLADVTKLPQAIGDEVKDMISRETHNASKSLTKEFNAIGESARSAQADIKGMAAAEIEQLKDAAIKSQKAMTDMQEAVTVAGGSVKSAVQDASEHLSKTMLAIEKTVTQIENQMKGLMDWGKRSLGVAVGGLGSSIVAALGVLLPKAS